MTMTTTRSYWIAAAINPTADFFFSNSFSTFCKNKGPLNQNELLNSRMAHPLETVFTGFCLVGTCSQVASFDHPCAKRTLQTTTEAIGSNKE